MPITQLVWGQNIPQEMMVHSKFFFCFFKDFISLTEIETASERGNTSRGGGRGRSRLIAEEPDVGLDPRTPGSRPEERQTLNRYATQEPLQIILVTVLIFSVAD